MNRRVTVEELAANVGSVLDDIRRGDTVIIVDGEKEIAVMEPARPVQIVPAANPGRLADIDFGSRPKRLRTDPAEIIIEERERERSGKKYGL
jgi:antitoxin (DNA-binding transcriptional repressor) of toxin-antitoxin stability system